MCLSSERCWTVRSFPGRWKRFEKSDVLLLLGTSLSSDVFRNYIKCFEGSKIVLIHNKEKLMDEKADLLIYDEPKNVLPKLGF